MASLRLLVVSDIHAGEAHGTDTYVPSEPPLPRNKLHPLNDLLVQAEELNLKADYLVVPGDLSNRADAEGLQYAWNKLNQIARAVDAKIVAAPGNHDVVTRTKVDDPRESLRGLLPTFPTGDARLDADFWAKGYCIIEDAEWRFLVLDSTFEFPKHPGTFASAGDEAAYLEQLNRGAISEGNLRLLEHELSSMTPKLNVVVLHHHPLEHQLRHHMQDWYGPMHNGGELIELLASRPEIGRWLVIHGHKHIPQLVQDVRTTSSGPVVLCAASLGHHLWAPATSFISNQFHVVDVATDRVPGVGSFTGTVQTFKWGFSFGWQLVSSDSLHLPPATGFGYICDTTELATGIRDHMQDQKTPLLRVADIESSFPMIKFLAPADGEALKKALRATGLVLERDEYGNVLQIVEANA